jgi:hypothetical protein
MSTDIDSMRSHVAIDALDLLAARDFDGLRALLAPDVKLDWPFHQSGAPVLIEGADAFIEAVRIVKVFQDLEIKLIEVNALEGTSILEARSRGTYADGRPSYANHYVFILKVIDGKVALWREFYNPLAVLQANAGARLARKAPAAA